MESFLNRYRNITVLLLVIFAQLVLLAMQVKNDQDVRVIRVWAITLVTPAARVAEWFRGGSVGFLRSYILLKDASAENKRLREEVGRLRIENNYLKNELNTADRAKALQMFKERTPSKLLAASVISAGLGSNSKTVFVNRGSVEGVMRGMGVVTPDGIVGKVIAAYPTASEVLLITDPEFKAGVVSQKNQVRGTLKGTGKPLCIVDYVPLEEKVEPGEMFYASGDDRVFPRGFAVGVAKVVQPGRQFKDIQVEPTGLQHGLDDVLIILEAVHQPIPETPPANQPVYLAPPPPDAPASTSTNPAPTATGTEADKLREQYKALGESQNHTFGVGAPGSKPPDFKSLGRGGATGATGASGGRGPAAAGGASGATAAPGTGGRAPAAGSSGSTTAPAGAGGRAPAAGSSGASGATAAPGTSGRGPAAGTSGSTTAPAGAGGGRAPAEGTTGGRAPAVPTGVPKGPGGALQE